MEMEITIPIPDHGIVVPIYRVIIIFTLWIGLPLPLLPFTTTDKFGRRILEIATTTTIALNSTNHITCSFTCRWVVVSHPIRVPN